ncbi:MAG: YceI family protein [Saprospiraceae bacterium]|nr:YceI family protein [Saprospiraceae bacterium]
MQKRLFILAALFVFAAPTFAQKYFTRDGKVKFFSDASMEKIEAVNKSATAVLDAATGKMEWKVLIKGFLFEKALMQEHFNENYMESSKYPNATFKGEITNLSEIDLSKDGTYKAKVKGKMNIHNVEKDMETAGTIKVSGNAITLHSEFLVKCSDHNIKIEAGKVANIANDIKVTVDATLNPMK